MYGCLKQTDSMLYALGANSNGAVARILTSFEQILSNPQISDQGIFRAELQIVCGQLMPRTQINFLLESAFILFRLDLAETLGVSCCRSSWQIPIHPLSRLALVWRFAITLVDATYSAFLIPIACAFHW